MPEFRRSVKRIRPAKKSDGASFLDDFLLRVTLSRETTESPKRSETPTPSPPVRASIMNIVILNTPDSPDASGNTVTALYAAPKLGPIVDGVAKVAGYQRRTLSFATAEKCLAWAAKEFNGGAPVSLAGDRIVAVPAAPEKPTKAAK